MISVPSILSAPSGKTYGTGGSFIRSTRLSTKSGDGPATQSTTLWIPVDSVWRSRAGGQPPIANVNLPLARGDTALLSGPSGAGKSTLVRAIAGIWPFGRGEIRMPLDARVLFLPQKPYLPIGTLRDVVSYPMPAGGVDDATLREALDAVGLPELARRLDDAARFQTSNGAWPPAAGSGR